jgi:hypothetical protein
VNSMAGLLTNLAAYQAGRTVWVYEPTQASKAPIKARLAAAASLAPIAPGTNVTFTTSNPDELNSLRAIMFGSFGPGLLTALTGGSPLKAPARLAAVSINDSKTFNNALDDDSFAVRSARKLTFSYEATSVAVISGAEVGATVTYQHYQAFPALGWVFGSYKFPGGGAPAGRPGYYLTIKRAYTLPAQVR